MSKFDAISNRESVWDYPRPPAVQRMTNVVEIWLSDQRLAMTNHAYRVLETSHPPTVYVPMTAIGDGILRPNQQRSMCEFKGQASYVDVTHSGREVQNAGWYYPHPAPGYELLADHIAFYPGKMVCAIDGETVQAQEGDFYGGWITSNITGPFKGGPGTRGW